MGQTLQRVVNPISHDSVYRIRFHESHRIINIAMRDT